MLYFVCSLVFLLIILFMIQRSALELRYSLLWILLAFVFIIISVFPEVLIVGKWIFGIETPVNVLFLIILGIQLLLTLMLTVILSRMSRKQKVMAQFIALSSGAYVKNSNVLVIIPAYNEAESIRGVVEDIRKHTKYDLIVINDCSMDSTYSVCKANDIPVLNLPINLGIGGAVQTGYKYAEEHGYEVGIQFDGDGQHNAAYLPELVEKLKSGYDMVIGSRFLQMAGKGAIDDVNFRTTTMRRIGIKYFMVLIRILTGMVVTDATSGMRVVGKSLLHEFSNKYPSDYPEPESLVFAFVKHFKVVELPVVMNARKTGKSSINALKSVYYMIKVSLAIIIARINIHD